MALRCRPGDLAIVVKSYAGNEGKVLTCVRFVGSVSDYPHDDMWETDYPTPDTHGGSDCYMPDKFLRPLRGDLTGDTESTDTPIRETA